MYLGYLARYGIELVSGRARVLDPPALEAAGARIEADFFVLATGARPRTLPGVTVDGRHVLINEGVVDLADGCESLLIVGAGVSGCEFASIFADTLQAHPSLGESLQNAARVIAGWLPPTI